MTHWSFPDILAVVVGVSSEINVLEIKVILGYFKVFVNIFKKIYWQKNIVKWGNKIIYAKTLMT